MLTKLNIVAVTSVVLLAAHDIRLSIAANKAAKLYFNAEKAYKEELMVEYAKVIYLCSVLEKHDVPADEFDNIALNFNN